MLTDAALFLSIGVILMHHDVSGLLLMMESMVMVLMVMASMVMVLIVMVLDCGRAIH